MNKRVFNLIIVSFLSLIFFHFWTKFYLFVAYPSLVMLLGSKGTEILSFTPLIIVIHLFATSLFAFNLWQLFNLTFYRPFLRFEFILYLLALFSAVLLKSRGVQGINLNPLELLTTFLSSPFEFFINLLMFIPLGAWFYLKKFSLKQTVFIGTIVIVFVELAQFLFSLGIMDIVDVILNLLGLVLGYLILNYLVDSGWTGVKKGKWLHISKRSHL